MIVVPLLFILVSAAFGESRSCHNCDRNCQNKYENVSLAYACIQGCHSSPGFKANADKYNVNIGCENFCKKFGTNDLKSACYGGCTYIPVLPIDSKFKPWGIFSNPLLSRILPFFGGSDESIGENPAAPGIVDSERPLIRETHIRIFIPDSPLVEQNVMDDEHMKMIMKFVHVPDDFPNGPSNPDSMMAIPSFARNFCFRTRAALHHLVAHPIFMASIIFMFISSVTLLIFACHRLHVRRAHRATFQRQYRRMPAFFKSPSMRVSLMTPQPPQSDDDEAPILPTKEPIV